MARRRICISSNIVTRYIYMRNGPAATSPDLLLKTLADFRFELRRFLHFSECAALEAGLQPQQHQLLLQVAGAVVDTPVTVAYAARRLGLKHNSAVELVDRSERGGLLSRTTDAERKTDSGPARGRPCA
jgi:DNA-binding MarR family transcriptional regulator